jgi:hypothetical protein
MKASMKNPLPFAFAALLACQTPCPTSSTAPSATHPVLAFPGPFPGNAAQGSVPYYGDAGFPVVLPVGLAGQPLFSGGAGANPYFGPGGNFLAISGTTSAPPTVAGGGWALVNTGTGSVVPTDRAYGIELAVPSNAGAFTAGLGYERACTGSPTCSTTMSVEVGALNVTSTQGGSTLQQTFWGAQMYEQATAKFISIYVYQPIGSASETSAPTIALVGSGSVSVTNVYSNFNSYTQPFVRLRLDGAGHIVGEFSVDRIRWINSGSAMTVNVSTVFTTGPDHVGFALGQSQAASTTYVSAFDFVTN